MHRLRQALVALALGASVMLPVAALAQFDPTLVPKFTIWDIRFGEPITQFPDAEVAEIACGTNGGPPSTPLRSFADYATCPPEKTGLREVYFTNDDEQDYIAKAMEIEYRVMQGGTSIYAHPVVFSVLVDDQGLARGIRIITDERASDRDRRVAVTLARNLKSRYGRWEQSCEDLAPTSGQEPVGKMFVHEICTAPSPEGDATMRLEATYFRKKGQISINPETQQINRNYFQSATRLEVVQRPYEPDTTPVR
jgi:hypothetical protein